jgi:hypothetical protein
MNKKGLFGIILIIMFFIVSVGGFGLLIFQELTSEYKYTAIVPCYDKYGNEIIDLVCEKDINCGWGANYDNSNWLTFPCDKNEYKGEFVLVALDEGGKK